MTLTFQATINELMILPVSAGLAFLLDLLIGDPAKLPHPVQGIGWLIKKLETRLYPTPQKPCHCGLDPQSLTIKNPQTQVQLRRNGKLLVAIVILSTLITTAAVITAAWLLTPWLALAVCTLINWQCLSMKSLRTEADKVWDELYDGTLGGARTAVSRLVGRDTENLTEEGVMKATVETVAENTTDGVVAPLFWMVIGGPALAMTYKAVNTMDSMLGYKNERYIDFGRAAALTDDAANYIPARIAAVAMIAAAKIMGFDAKGARRIWKRDRRNHPSPNSAQTESVCAGALGIRLGGTASYFGKTVEKKTIGDPVNPIRKDDIIRSQTLMMITSTIAGAVFIILQAVVLRLVTLIP
jgi:adenosylcobinamide-phosphate synthase